MMRTHNCGELTKKDDKKEVTLCGWNNSRRDHGGIIFIDLRDRYGKTQIIFDPSQHKEIHSIAEKLRHEDVLQIKGKVRLRGKGLENPKLATGEIEVLASAATVLSRAETPPIEIDDFKEASEEMRMKYRYLDLRRPVMQRNLLFRSKALQVAREYLLANNFIEIQTPLLVKTTPEGARDYVVPSRVHPGKFYSLPQSPQLYKQILMVSGFDRYFQLPAICLRDEDLRQDRQPEHSQIDLEMSFVEIDDLLLMWEGLIKHLFKKTLGVEIKTPLQRIPYSEAMEKYGSDKPDLRFGLELANVTDEAAKSDYGIFKAIVEHGGIVKCIAAPIDMTRKQIEEMIEFATGEGAKGLSWIKYTAKAEFESSIAKYFDKKLLEKITVKTGAKKGSTLFFVADIPVTANKVMSRIRLKLGNDLKLYNPKDFVFAWITDFPLFEWDYEEEKWTPAHHMFCLPRKEHIQFIRSDPGKVLCTQYDLTLNGVELGSGSLRITDPILQKEVMGVVGLPSNEAEQKFGFLMESFKYGVPPHGGVGLGLDRIVALMLGYNDIREVIAFPKTKNAECLMDGSPSDITERQFKELHIKVDVAKKGN